MQSTSENYPKLSSSTGSVITASNGWGSGKAGNGTGTSFRVYPLPTCLQIHPEETAIHLLVCDS